MKVGFPLYRHLQTNTPQCAVVQIIDQFGRKRCQKKRKEIDYKLLKKFFQKYYVVHEQSAVENLFSTCVCYDPDGLFWLNLYVSRSKYSRVRPHLKPLVTL